jgi:ribonucleotide monophosphatase NagD (HAD superfamily)
MSGKHVTTGFVIDVDTVLVRQDGQTAAAPGAREAIDKLQAHDIAFTIISSDARTTEKHIKHDIEDYLGLVVKSRFIVVPQTPCRDLAEEYGNQVVLVVGDSNGRARNFAHYYGFQHVMTPNDIVELFPHLYCAEPNRSAFRSTNPPWKPAFTSGSGPRGEVRIAAVFVWWSPPATHWDRDLRIVTDILLSQAGYVGTRRLDPLEQQPRLFICGAGIADPLAAGLPRSRTWLDELQRSYHAESGGVPLQFEYVDDPDTLLHHADRALEFVNDKLHPWMHNPNDRFPRTIFRIGADTIFNAACSRVKNFPEHPNTRRRYIVVDPVRGGNVEAALEYPRHSRPWYVAASLQDAVDYALTDEYWDCVEYGLKPTWPAPE